MDKMKLHWQRKVVDINNVIGGRTMAEGKGYRRQW